MTLTTQTQRWEYVGDGATTIFAYDARVDIASDMKAFLNGLPTDISFTVTGLGNDNGGDVIFNSPPALGVAISLERILPFQQTTDFPVRGPFPAEANEDTFDRIVMMLQQTRTNLIDIQDYLGIGVGGGGEIFPIGGQVPPGAIMAWPFGVDTIPNGWFLCDGTNGTPDGSGRVVVGIDEDGVIFNNVLDMGGVNEVALTLDEMPNHKHDVSPVGVDGLVTPPTGGSTTTGGSESRADVLVDGVTGHTQADGVALPHENMPPYTVWCWIQYQGGSLPPSFTGSIPNTTFTDNEVITPIDVSGQFFVGDGTNPVYTASGLPPGLSIDPVSGIISGTVDANASATSPYMVTVQLTTSINPPATSFPIATWTVLVEGSAIVSWLAGAGAPVIDGPTWSTIVSDSSVYDPVASTINTVDSDTGLYYAEFSIPIASSAFDLDDFGMGWSLQASVNTTTFADFLGIWWQDGINTWRMANDLNGSATESFDVQPAIPPVDGMRLGVALDCLNNKMYIQADGVWLTTAGATEGGNPAGGLGWDILNPANIAVLYSFCQGNNQTMRAETPAFLPAGYTAVT